jgi:hypothetical protein
VRKLCCRLQYLRIAILEKWRDGAVSGLIPGGPASDGDEKCMRESWGAVGGDGGVDACKQAPRTFGRNSLELRTPVLAVIGTRTDQGIGEVDALRAPMHQLLRSPGSATIPHHTGLRPLRRILVELERVVLSCYTLFLANPYCAAPCDSSHHAA